MAYRKKISLVEQREVGDMKLFFQNSRENKIKKLYFLLNFPWRYEIMQKHTAK